MALPRAAATHDKKYDKNVLRFAACEVAMKQALPDEIAALRGRVRQLEAQLLSPYDREDGAGKKTWQEIARNSQLVIAEARDEQEHAWGMIHQATQLLEGARAHAGRANTEMFEAGGRSAPQQALETVHNIICDAVEALDEV